MKKEKMLKHLDNALEKQVPDIWDEIQKKVHRTEKLGNQGDIIMQNNVTVKNKKRSLYKRISIAAAICLITVSTLTFTPALAAIQEVLDKIFSSNHIDDSGLKMAINAGHGQTVNQTYYDKKHDITVHFESVLTDDKETKLLLTYQSKKTNLKHYYVDIFEGKSSINLIVGNAPKKRLHAVGWGSRYYDEKENKVVEAESFDSIKDNEGQNIHLEIENLTIYDDQKTGEVKTIWPLEFKLGKSAISTRETVNVDKDFTFENQHYRIKKVEFSAMETRVVVTGSDTKLITENGKKYHVMSKLEHQFLHARTFNKKYGYIVDKKKSGVFLRSAGKRVDPIFSKGEVQGADDEYIMFFAPVKDRQNCVLEVGEGIKIPLKK